jgi:hypothetical protein
MHTGLPSLLDAIFGKQDLASVSLDEMYEVINEFPSFNAAHFLLAKKLKEQNDAAYDHESKRTALYFNNVFWLQTLLDEENHNRRADLNLPVSEENEESVYVDKSYQDLTPSHIENELDEETEEILDEEIEGRSMPSGSRFQDQQPITGTVSSFDELISKYKIETEEVIYKTPEEIQTESRSDNGENSTVLTDEPISGLAPEPHTEYSENLVAEPVNEFRENEKLKQDDIHEPLGDEKEEFEIREEILNDYGIFEEVVIKKTDHDLAAFDRPIEQIPGMHETLLIQTEAISTPAEPALPVGEAFFPDTEQADNSTIVENQVREETPDKTDEHDYDAFDRPLEEIEPEPASAETGGEPEFSEVSRMAEADDTEKTVVQYGVPEEGLGIEMQGLADRIDEHRKAVAVFDSKNADSIVFAPYHMIDYFASQGIKLVLEDNPADNLGRQLKSFTDWLKVMKKLPAQPESDKADEKEADRIRHFAAHSIEERDILTESMAEVLAKQGMYENAIALYQKLSLIYPPKSAYFASRIEQLKASLP